MMPFLRVKYADKKAPQDEFWASTRIVASQPDRFTVVDKTPVDEPNAIAVAAAESAPASKPKRAPRKTTAKRATKPRATGGIVKGHTPARTVAADGQRIVTASVAETDAGK